MSEWLKTYGVDKDFGLRRNRRIIERAFKRMLHMKYVRFVCKYGVVYLDQYPVKPWKDVSDHVDGELLYLIILY
jgi:hypothetical protein